MRLHPLAMGAALALALCCANVSRAADINAAMLRFPNVSATQIVFVYDNDVWVAPKDGGTAVPLSSPPGMEILPHFNPDGTQVAFTADYDGTENVYVMPVTGGVPKRLTYGPAAALVVGWSPDGRVLFNSSEATPGRGSNLYYADMDGRLPEALPVQFGAFGSISADGQWLAFSPWSTEFRTWNRYQGGLASDIWLFNLKTHESRKITNFPGTDDMPMFHGNLIYFLSDCGDACRRNIWVYDIATNQRQQVTFFTDYDVKWPSIGPNEVVFENGGKLYLLSLADHSTREVHINVPGDHPNVRPQTVSVGAYLMGASISPGAKRVAVDLRGDVWSVPAEKGYSMNLTRSNGVAERDPAWSPDGKWIAYFSDQTGEYELWVRPADGTGEPKQLTKDGNCFRFSPTWSPDSKKIAFSDKTGAFFIHILDGETVKVDRDEWGAWGIAGQWAKDSNWFAYGLSDPDRHNGVVKLYDLANRAVHQVTSAHLNAGSPSFDAGGDFLYFTIDRSMQPSFGYEGNFIFSDSTQLAVVPLRKDVKSPFLPKNDEDDAAKKEQDKKIAEAKAAKPEVNAGKTVGDEAKENTAAHEETLKIEFDGIEERAEVTPGIESSSYWNVVGGDKKVFYIRGARRNRDNPPQLWVYTLDDQKETKLLDGVGGFELTPDRANLMVYARGGLFITRAGPGANLDKPVNLDGNLVQLDPRQEWREVVLDAWRIYRDFFYDPNMHGVDWPKVRDHALDMVQYAASREDVDYIIASMVSELNSSHTYVGSPPTEQARQLSVGNLGCEFQLAKDADGHEGYSIKRIMHAPEWELMRGPLEEAGVDVHEGDFLLAVNGVPLAPPVSPYASLQGAAGNSTRLTVSNKAVLDDSARQALVTPLGDDSELRYRDFMERNRKYVADKSGGKIGYIYVRDTSFGGLTDLMRQFIGQHEMAGLIIDERWNHGGMIPDRFIELLNRPVKNYWARRDGKSERTPEFSHQGPMVMLINQAAGSGGDAFPYYFRQGGLGKLIGTRTWGGLIGISGNPEPIDGSGITVPTFGIYSLKGAWTVEGHGIDPDIEVVNDPTSLAAGKDNQLDKGVEEVMKEIAEHPFVPAPKPAYPNRSKEGLPTGQEP